MSGISLGKLLAEAGVKGTDGKSVATFEDLRMFANRDPESSFPNEAMERLPQEFQSLKTISKGKDFTEKLIEIIERMIEAGKGNLVTEHVVYGVIQIAHCHRDHLSGSKRSSFKDRVIPVLLEAKSQMLKKRPPNLAEFLLMKIK